MDSLILADDSLLKFSFKVLELISVRLCDLCRRDACPLCKYDSYIIDRESACEAFIIRLNLILKE